MAFNPDEYLEEKNKFDPDSYLAQKKQIEPESNFKSFVRETKGSLPMVGSVAGGAIGSAVAGAPTMGTALIPSYLAGSAAGATLGKGIENLIDQYYLDQPNPNAVKDVALAPVYDVLGNVTGEKIVAPVMNLAAKGATKVASSMSGIPEQVINSYVQHYTDVNRIDDVVNEADRIRQYAQDKIKNFKNIQNSKISNALSSKGNQLVDIMPTRQALVDSIKRLDPVINESEIRQLHKQIQLIDSIGGVGMNNGIATSLNVPAEQAYALQKKLQDMSEYLEPGQIFKKKNFVDLSYQKAAAKTRSSLSNMIPEIAEANKQLSSIRNIDKNINKNLITPEKSMNAMLSVGSGTNPVMEKQVEKLSNVIGEDFLTPMQKLSAARSFSNPDLVSTLQTGRAALPALAAGATGGALGGGVIGGLAGLASMSVTTPLGIKGTIATSKIAQKYGFTPSRIVGETVQGLSPLALEYIQQQIPQPQPEQPTDRAERINQERKMLKGK